MSPLNIASIRIQRTSSNLAKLVAPITYLDQIISDKTAISDFKHKIPNNPEYCSILLSLFKYSLKPSITHKGNPYIFKTWDCFVNNKKEIRLNLDDMNGFCSENEDFMEVLFTYIVRKKYGRDHINEDQNLIKKDVLKVFKNVTYLYISSKWYSFSLEAFLSVIDGTRIDKIVIDDNEGQWLPYIVLETSFNSICTKYENANYKLEYDYQDEDEDYERPEVTITITKQN